MGSHARSHTDTAINALVGIAKTGLSESAKVAAASALLDRGYGRTRQALEHTGADGGPIQQKRSIEVRFIAAPVPDE